ncbi:MAG: hypothetical protein M1837_000403 [Sclerophora amabilis]|nr:MAG: hypothetical protein M1837_000403 [Sclerophora amabilis]
MSPGQGEAEMNDLLSNVMPPLPCLDKSFPNGDIRNLESLSPSVSALKQLLTTSLNLRIRDVPSLAMSCINDCEQKTSKIAILFSGGVDCTVLARIANDLVPMKESIDLLNVAFENPRIIAAANKGSSQHRNKPGRSDDVQISPNELDGENQSVDPGKSAFGPQADASLQTSPYDNCPDRVTARSSLAELQQINVPYPETLRHRRRVVSLIHPHNTEMDLSIGYAFYFAARGEGHVYDSASNTFSEYKTCARILLSGLGADELFAGYTRHATAFHRRGFSGLTEELELDFSRLGKRNLGRDDRIISSWGKEARFPYLDEDLLRWAMSCPVWEKCGFGQKIDQNETNEGGGLEPGKKVLRLLAWNLGMKRVAAEKKRAVSLLASTHPQKC